MLDVVIIGAGPVGLACGIEAKREGLDALLIEKGGLVHSLVGYPNNMEFFSTPELLEIGGYPFMTAGYKPTREEGIEYYRRVAAAEGLTIRLHERVKQVEGENERFVVQTDKGRYKCRKVVIATGFFDVPNLLNVPGEDLPKVTHYYKEPYPYLGQKVAIVGAKNSAAKAALQCYRHGIETTLVVRGSELSDKIKYWIRPDLENRIREGSIRAYFNTTISAITEHAVLLETPGGAVEIENDWLLALTGYRPDYRFLESLSLDFMDDACRTPVYDPETFETSRSGIYMAGTVCGGLNTSKWFIENGRFHAMQIMQHIAHGLRDTVELEGVHWKTAE